VASQRAAPSSRMATAARDSSPKPIAADISFWRSPDRPGSDVFVGEELRSCQRRDEQRARHHPKHSDEENAVQNGPRPAVVISHRS
jgi:hypothetical protein